MNLPPYTFAMQITGLIAGICGPFVWMPRTLLVFRRYLTRPPILGTNITAPELNNNKGVQCSTLRRHE
jgi:hypothetical protein